MPTAAVVFNPVKIDVDDLRKVIDPAAAQAGWDESMYLETSEDDPGTGMAREAVERQASVVLAVGGDGTVRGVAEGLRDTGVPLALCPQGTGNLLARNLELTLDNLEESTAACFNGVDRPIDLGVAMWSRPGGKQEEHSFLVMAGLGLDAQMISNSDEELKKKLGVAAYAKSLVVSLKDNHRMRLLYRLDEDELRKARLHTIMVGNCGSLQNNVLLLPDAAVDDGVLDVVAMRPQGLFGWAQIMWKVLVENALLRRSDTRALVPNRDDDRQLNYQQCQRVELFFREPEEIELDGDHFGEVLAVRMSVDPGGLVVKMPPGWTREG
ncbi:diacylglycerol kinase [Naumannella sp. ID2617S]|nr:diacylglycerol kinase [Naumannella sp. ID2617S]